MAKFERFVVSASAATLVALASLWASAAGLSDEQAERCVDVASETAETDAEYEDAYRACELETLGDVLDVDSFVYASRNVAAAPAFCAVTFVERAPNGSYRAVCVLEGAL
jgi:hypothetical protein